MIPLWKLKRELETLRQQFNALVGLFWEPFAQFSYDRNRGKNLQISQGKQALLPKVAIFLIHQPKGVCTSTLRTIEYLTQKGYATLVVSNGPLQPASMAALTDVAWQVMVRPNYGYDFGGYRDAVLSLFEADISPDRLLIINDSMWFPLGGSERIIAQIEASDLDVGGTIVHRAFGRNRTRKRQIRVVESYFYLFSHRAFVNPSFKKFWKDYRLSSTKYNAVHRGERRVAETMMAAGLNADGVFARDAFLAKISECDNAFLYKTLYYNAHTREAYKIENARLLAIADESEAWRAQVLTFIAKVFTTSSFHSSFIYAAVQLLDLPFLKKGNGEMQMRMRDAYIRAVVANDLSPPRDDVWQEIMALKGVACVPTQTPTNPKD